MPLANLLWVFITFNLLSSILAGPNSTTCLSPYLSSVIPTCAHPCLKSFIAISFPPSICRNQQDHNCLCTSNSETGLTLGEGAFECVAVACEGESALTLSVAYGVCLGVESAKPMTHTIITATLQVPTTTTVTSQEGQTTTSFACPSITSLMTTPTSTSQPLPSSFPSSSDGIATGALPTGLLTATDPQPTLSSTSALLPSELSTTTTLATLTSSSSFTAASAITSPSKAANTALTRPQIAGVAVAGAGTAAIVFALLGFCFCFKKRRRSKRDSDSSFGADEIVEDRSDPPNALGATFSNPERARQEVGEAPIKAQRLLGVPSQPNENMVSLWRRPMVKPEDIGVAVAPGGADDITRETSPISPASYRTTSGLLPDKPSYSLYPSPLQPRPSKRPASAIAHSIEGDEIDPHPPIPPPKPTLQKHMDSRHLTSSDPFLDTSSDPRARMYAMERQHAMNSGGAKGIHLPRLITPGVQTLHNNSWSSQQNPERPNRPPLAYLWEGALPLSTSGQGPSQTKPPSQFANLNPYPSCPSYIAYNPKNNVQSQLAKSTPYSRKSGGRRPLTHLTTASDTSFEDEGDDVDELPGPTLALSPVVESPKIHSPISKIRYPTVPGSTASIKERRLSPISPTRRPPRRPYQPAQSVNPSKGDNNGSAYGSEPVARSDFPLATRQGPQEAATAVHGLRERQNPNGAIKVSAKQKILCSPGYEGIENCGSPRTGRSDLRTSTRPPRHQT